LFALFNSYAEEKAFIIENNYSFMKRKKSSIVIIILILAAIISIPFLERVIPSELVNEFGQTILLGPPTILIVILIVLLIVLNRNKTPRDKTKKQEKDREKHVPHDLQEKREQIVQELKEAEKQFLKNRIDKNTFDDISRKKNAELIRIEADLDSEKKDKLVEADVKQIDAISRDKKKVLSQLLKQKQGKVHELQVAEKSFYKRRIDENTFKKIGSEIKAEIISIEGKIKAIQKSEEIQKIKQQLKEGAKEIAKQAKTSKQRKSANDIFEEEVFDQLDFGR